MIHIHRNSNFTGDTQNVFCTSITEYYLCLMFLFRNNDTYSVIIGTHRYVSFLHQIVCLDTINIGISVKI